MSSYCVLHRLAHIVFELDCLNVCYQSENFQLFTEKDTSKRTFLDTVRGSTSEKVSRNCPSTRPFAGLVNWLAEYQIEGEHVALAKATNESVVKEM